MDQSTAQRPPPRVTVGVPLLNEEENVPELLRQVGAALDGMGGEGHEILLVDDGSTDRTLLLLEEAAARDPRVRVVSLSRNYGHQPAVTAAMQYARGDVLVLMDGDLQDDPVVIPTFVEKYREGYDVVYATRAGRKEHILLRLMYFLFYRFIRMLSDVDLPLDAGDFSLLSRKAVDAINSAGDYNRYVRGLRAWAGFRQIGVPVKRNPRLHGAPKYTVRALIRLAADGLFSFSVVPLRLAALLGVLLFSLAAAYGSYALAMKLLYDESPAGFTALVVLLVMLSGVQLLFLGVLGEYLGRIYRESKGRPVFVVDRVVHKGSAADREGPPGE